MQRSAKPSAAQRFDAESCARAIMDAVPPVVWFMRREMRVRRGSLSLPRFRALVRVNHGDAGVSDVAEHLGVSVPTASRIITGLVTQGLLARRSGGRDKRRVGLVVTAKGKSVLAAARSGTLERVEAEIAHLDDAERKSLVDAMDLLKRLFGPLGIPEKIDNVEK